MTDSHKDLITLAAKAMGYEYKWNKDKCFITGNGIKEWIPFNPLTSLSDRAKMCDQLGIDVIWIYQWNEVRAAYAKVLPRIEVFEPYTTDKSAACSLVCLRVAAEIGKRQHNNS